MLIDRRTLWQVITEHIRQQISDGIYPAGAPLPSIHEITEGFECSTTTARRVLGELAATGWSVKQGTRGSVSTGVPPASPEEQDERPRRTDSVLGEALTRLVDIANELLALAQVLSQCEENLRERHD